MVLKVLDRIAYCKERNSVSTPPIQFPVKQAMVTKGRCNSPVVKSTIANMRRTKKEGVRRAAL